MFEELIDPELRPLLDLLPVEDFCADELPAIRARLVHAAVGAPFCRGAETRVDCMYTDGFDGHVPVRVLAYRPVGADGVLPAILHVHGGGYVIGLPEMDDCANRTLAAKLQCAIFSVDYRLSPEAPYPCAVDDCDAVLQWLHRHAATLKIEPGTIGVKGESAGGGIAAGLALRVRDRGGPRLAFQHLLYPMLDDRTCLRTDLPAFA